MVDMKVIRGVIKRFYTGGNIDRVVKEYKKEVGIKESTKFFDILIQEVAYGEINQKGAMREYEKNRGIMPGVL